MNTQSPKDKTKRKFKWPKLSWPYLDLWISVPFLSIRTELMRQSYERFTYEYIVLDIKLWKWQWRFRLYRPGRTL